jgi:Protein of unknown function (DUF3168)
VTFSAASPVSAAIFQLQQADAALVAAAVGGIHDDVPQKPTYPFVWNEVFDETDARGFGGGGLPLIDFRTHVFSKYGGKAEAQALNRLVIAALKDQRLTIEGYEHCGAIFYDETVSLDVEELNGEKVHELVSRFRIYAEEL